MGQPGAIAPSRANTMVPGAQLLLAVAAHFRAQRASRAPIASRPISVDRLVSPDESLACARRVAHEVQTEVVLEERRDAARL